MLHSNVYDNCILRSKMLQISAKNCSKVVFLLKFPGCLINLEDFLIKPFEPR